MLCTPVVVATPKENKDEDFVDGVSSCSNLARQRGQGSVKVVLQCVTKTSGENSFSAQDEVVLSALAQAAGSVLRRAESGERLKREENRNDGLMVLLRALSEQESNGGGEEGMRELIGRTVVTAARVLGCERVELFFVDVDEGREEMYHAASSSLRSPSSASSGSHVSSPSGGSVGVDESGKRRRTALARVAMRVAKDGVSLGAAFNRTEDIDERNWMEELLHEPPYAPTIKSLLCVPVFDTQGTSIEEKKGSDVLAVILASNKLDEEAGTGEPFTEADHSLVNVNFSFKVVISNFILLHISRQTLAYLIGRILRKNLSELRAANRLSDLSDEESTRLESLLKVYFYFIYFLSDTPYIVASCTDEEALRGGVSRRSQESKENFPLHL